MLLWLNSHDVIYGKKRTLWKQKINEKYLKYILEEH